MFCSGASEERGLLTVSSSGHIHGSALECISFCENNEGDEGQCLEGGSKYGMGGEFEDGGRICRWWKNL